MPHNTDIPYCAGKTLLRLLIVLSITTCLLLISNLRVSKRFKQNESALKWHKSHESRQMTAMMQNDFMEARRENRELTLR